MAVATDENGRYTLRNLSEGEYEIKATLLGYVCEPVKVVVKGIAAETQADLVLVPEGMIAVPSVKIMEPGEEGYQPVESSAVGEAAENEAEVQEAGGEKETKKKKKWWEK